MKKQATLIRLGIIVILIGLLPPLPSMGNASVEANSPQLFPDNRFFEEPNFFLKDFRAFLSTQPGTLPTLQLSYGTAGDAIYYAGNTFRYSLNVKLLLTLVEMRSGLVTEPQPSPEQSAAPMGLASPIGFEAQLAYVAEALVRTYYSYKPGATITFVNGSSYVVPADVNAASYAIMTVLAELAPDHAVWEQWVAPQSGTFVTTFEKLFGTVEPIPPVTSQFPGDGDPAFLDQPYEGDAVATFSYFDHKYPTYTEWPNSEYDRVVIYTGDDLPSCDRSPPPCYWYDGHDGYDYLSSGRNVVAAADGTIDTVYIDYYEPGWPDWCGYSYTPVNAVIINHDPDGDSQFEFKTRYWHLADIAINPDTGQVWATGDEIEQGNVLGPTGSTGCSSGPHLHFAARRNGEMFDPYGWGGDYDDPWGPWSPGFWLWGDSDAEYPAETMYIEYPGPDAHVGGTVRISGWAINRHYGPDTGVGHVVIYLDDEARAGQYLGQAVYGDYRPDVGDYFGDRRFDYSGYHFDWNTSGVTSGWHTLYVYSRSIEKNNWFFHTRRVYVEADSIRPNTTITSGPSGWINTDSATFQWTGSDNQTPLEDLVYSYRLADYSNWSGWTSNTSKTYTNLPDASYTFYVKARDEAHNEDDTPAERPFAVDTHDPTNPTSVNPGCSAGNNQWQNVCNDANFTWSGASDGNGSGVKDYHLYWGESSSGSPSTYVTSPAYDPGPIPDGKSYYLRIATRDNVLNERTPATLFILRYDATPPEISSFLINGGALTTTQVTVRLDVAATDSGSGVYQMRFSNNGLDWSPWEAYAPESTWALPALDRRTLTVYAEVRDRAGNVDNASDSIYLDLYPPPPHSESYRICDDLLDAAGGQLTATSYLLTSAVGQPVLGDFTADEYTADGGFLARLDACMPITRPITTGITLTQWVIAAGGSLRGSTTYRLGDTAGETAASEANAFSSASYRLTSGFWANITGTVPLPPPPPPTVTPPVPTVPPTPAPTPTPPPAGFGVLVNADDAFTNQPVVTLTLWGPGVTEMQISNDAGFGEADWETYRISRTWTISTAGDYLDPRVVYARFRDWEGTVYGDYTDDIVYDPISPTGHIAIVAHGASTVTLWLEAEDDNSGVEGMRLADDETGLIVAPWQTFTNTAVYTPTGERIYAQFRDQALNVSDPVFASMVNRIYLPIVVRGYE